MRGFKKNILVFITISGFCSTLCGQENMTEAMAARFDQYQQQVLYEKIYAHTDKNFYLAGEILWFKLYYVDGNLHKPIDLSKVTYVEIIDKDLKPVIQGKIALNRGVGNGSFYLPVSLNSGVYKLRAYTNWMKNFSADYFFEKSITIINPMKRPVAQPAQPSGYDVDFFPEGGNLVQGIQSKVAFRVADRSGKGMDCMGAVIDRNNDTVVRFHPLKFGLGNFALLPAAGNTYRAVIRIGDTAVIMHELPVASEQGYVMRVTNEGESQLRIRVQTNIQSADVIYLFIHTRQSIKIADKGSFTNGIAEFIVGKNKLGEGISNITIINSAKQPVCERLYFILPTQGLNIQMTADRQEFVPRKKVDLSVTTTNGQGKSIPADMSVSVYRIDSLQTGESGNITNYLWLTSDLRGKIESPGYYFSDKSGEAADNLMLTHGWRRFQWQGILQNTKPVFDFLPEMRGHIIAGRVTDIKSGLPAPNVLTYFSVPGKRVQLYGSKSDQEGKILFYTKDFYGPNEIILQTDSRTDTTYRIEITNPFAEKFSSSLFLKYDLPKSLKDPLLDHSVGVQVQNEFSGTRLKQFDTPEIDSAAFYGKPDAKYLLDDYTRFSTMEEVLREYVYEVLVRRQKENFRLIMADGANKVFMDDPITLLNGVPVFETNKLMQFDPLKIKNVEVIKRRYFSGPFILNGIVNFTTYDPEPPILTDISSIVLDYEGLQFQREFYAPVYETQEQITRHLPDFRNVLYWSPAVMTDGAGKTGIGFYTSDQKGKYLVVIQGMNSEGMAGQTSFSFEVK